MADTYWWCLFLYKKYLYELLAPGTHGLIPKKKSHEAETLRQFRWNWKPSALIGQSIWNVKIKSLEDLRKYKETCTLCGVDGRKTRHGYRKTGLVGTSKREIQGTEAIELQILLVVVIGKRDSLSWANAVLSIGISRSTINNQWL